MESMIEKVLKSQQKTSAYLNLRLDVLYRELNGKFEALDAHVMMLDAQVSQTAEAVKKQEALEKLEEDAFLVESSMYIGNSYWCQPTPTTEHRPTSSAEHRPTPLLGSDKTVRIQSHSNFAARHSHPPTLARVKRDNIDRQQYNGTDRQQHGNTDRQQQKSSDQRPPMPYQVRLPDPDAPRLKETRNPSQTSVCLKTTEKISQQSAEALEQEQSTLAETSFVESVDRRYISGVDRHQMDGHKPAMEWQATEERIPTEKRVKSRKPYIPKHLRREASKVELDGFHKRVKRVPKDMCFEDAYHKYRLGNFFRESKETGTCLSVPEAARRNYFSSQTQHVWNARSAKRNAHHRWTLPLLRRSTPSLLRRSTLVTEQRSTVQFEHRSIPIREQTWSRQLCYRGMRMETCMTLEVICVMQQVICVMQQVRG
ncbi:hypothetical protein DY000_02046813 [Brassica cretica]|uniref:Shugoshin C-terminal domain-containing protein n=1 Tax=Brassica cretica TaxID=69181 RepID=A0ABQ7F0D5_BRACR|nr:hypothetical protein DY000_02046813 [Brassica cretica]